jgi:hypothetical protein
MYCDIICEIWFNKKKLKNDAGLQDKLMLTRNERRNGRHAIEMCIPPWSIYDIYDIYAKIPCPSQGYVKLNADEAYMTQADRVGADMIYTTAERGDYHCLGM